MSELKTTTADFEATLNTHEGHGKRLLMLTLVASESAAKVISAPANVAVVIDRSSSMSGDKLRIAREATARLIRSLAPTDRIGIVAYDDRVQVISGLSAPGETAARAVEHMDVGGSTNLYEGWLTGAKIVGAGGRVILLSDGQANVGRYTDAGSLGHHAGISNQRFQVTTSTVGIGTDYDEGVMAGMARQGGGQHYFAHTPSAIMEAFSQERLAIDSLSLTKVSIRFGNITHQLGQFGEGEQKRVVLQIPDLNAAPATLRYTVVATGETKTVQLETPREFGYSDDATLELLVEQAAELEGQAMDVRSPQSARQAKESLRALLLQFLNHPLSDGDLATAVRTQIQASIARLTELEEHFDEQSASMHRKQSMQSSHNFRERDRAFSAFPAQADIVEKLSSRSNDADGIRAAEVDLGLFVLAPPEKWIAWRALPVRLDNTVLRVVMLNPKDGFTLKEIEDVVKRRVSPLRRRVGESALLDVIHELASGR